MRRFVGLVVLALLSAGCLARGSGDDPWAYTRKPLYTGHFDLASVPASGDAQAFKVDDGSIKAIRLQLWINATSGGARVLVSNPSGHVVLDATSTTETRVGLELGAWTVRIDAEDGSAGTMQLLVTRG